MKYIFLFLLVTSFSIAQNKLPNIQVKDLNNRPTNLSATYNDQDKLYVFSFWATWCAPCIRELEAISEVYEEWQDEVDMELIAISIDDARTKKRIRPMLNGRNWPYEVLIDSNHDLKRALSIVNIPYTIVVKNQKIVKIVNGYTQGGEKELFESLKAL